MNAWDHQDDAGLADGDRLAELVDEISERFRQEEAIDLSIYTRRHPELAQSLRAAYESLLGMRQLSQDDSGEVARPQQLGDFRLLLEIDISVDNLLAVAFETHEFLGVPDDQAPVDVLLFRILDEGGRITLARVGPPLAGCQGTIRGVCFSPDGKLLAAASDNSRPLVWRVAEQQQLVGIGDEFGPILDVSFSPDSRWLASTSSDRTVKLWDARSGRWWKDLDAVGQFHLVRSA